MTLRQFFEQRLHRAWQHKGLFSTLLSPLSCLTAIYTRRKRQQYEQQPSLTYFSHTPVIVVGNLVVGGAGKTPVVMALIDQLRLAGYQPGVISRGYGIKMDGQARTSKANKEASFLGDEPALIHQQKQVPVAVHPQRVLALQALNQDFPEVDVVIADDGLQHLALGRQAEIIVQDQRGIGNGRLLPAGPLRESPQRLKQAHIIVSQITADNAFNTHVPATSAQKTVEMRLWPRTFTALNNKQSLNLSEATQRFRSSRVVACAAIGQPSRFFIMLGAAGINLAEQHAFPDHYDYADNPFSEIKADFILITPKDAVKCKKFDDPRLWVVSTETQFSDLNWANPVLNILAKLKR